MPALDGYSNNEFDGCTEVEWLLCFRLLLRGWQLWNEMFSPAYRSYGDSFPSIPGEQEDSNRKLQSTVERKEEDPLIHPKRNNKITLPKDEVILQTRQTNSPCNEWNVIPAPKFSDSYPLSSSSTGVAPYEIRRPQEPRSAGTPLIVRVRSRNRTVRILEWRTFVEVQEQEDPGRKQRIPGEPNRSSTSTLSRTSIIRPESLSRLIERTALLDKDIRDFSALPPTRYPL